jgi:hypothetical protein
MSRKYSQKDLINDVLRSNWKEKNFHPNKRVQSLRIVSLNRRNIAEFSICIIYNGEILNENLESTGIELLNIESIHLKHDISGIDVFYNIEKGEWDYELNNPIPVQLSLW